MNYRMKRDMNSGLKRSQQLWSVASKGQQKGMQIPK